MKQGFFKRKIKLLMLTAVFSVTAAIFSQSVYAMPSYGFGAAENNDSTVYLDVGVNSADNRDAVHIDIGVMGTAQQNIPQNSERIGTLTIPSGRQIGVFGGESLRSMEKGAAHFSNTGLNWGNTAVIGHSSNRARFLGYDITVSRNQEIKRNKDGSRARVFSGVVKLYIPHEKWETKLREYGVIRIVKDKITGKEHWRVFQRGKLINFNDIQILSKINAEVRGFYNYYSLACNACNLNKFSSLMKYSMLKTFGAKYRCQVSKIKARYVKNGNFTVA